MFKRFLQNNLLLVVMLAVSLLVVVGLLVLAAAKHVEMRQASGDVNRLREKIADLQRGQKIAPVQENLDRITRDNSLYSRKVAEAAALYGRPLDAARDAMAQKLGFKDGSEMKAKFMELYNSKKGNSTRGQIYDTFKREFGDKWDPAIEEFRRKADMIMVEKVDDSNKDSILLDQLGVARNSDNDPRSAARVVAEVQRSIYDLMQKNSIRVSPLAAKLAVGGVETAKEQEIIDALRLLEVSSDLARRISGSGINSLDELSVQEVAPKADSDGFIVYCFNIEVTGKLSAVRKLVDLLNIAELERRVYAVQSIMLERCEDEAKAILDRTLDVKEAVPAVASKPNAAAVKVEEKKELDESKYQPHERKSYARPVLGMNEYCVAVISVVYIINQEK